MSGRLWTPYELKLFMHHALSHDRFPAAGAPIYAGTLDRLVVCGLLEWRDGIPRATAKGDHFLELLLQTPMPEAVFIDPRDGKHVMSEHHEAA